MNNERTTNRRPHHLLSACRWLGVYNINTDVDANARTTPIHTEYRIQIANIENIENTEISKIEKYRHYTPTQSIERNHILGSALLSKSFTLFLVGRGHGHGRAHLPPSPLLLHFPNQYRLLYCFLTLTCTYTCDFNHESPNPLILASRSRPAFTNIIA